MDRCENPQPASRRILSAMVQKPIRTVPALIALGAAAVSGIAFLPAGGTAQTGAAAVELQPHRIAYEVSLGPRSGSAFSNARGIIALEFTGNACDGFATNFRQATELSDSEGQVRNLDFKVNLWEAARGDRFRFTVLSKVNGTITRDADGEARRVRDGSLSVAMAKPRGKKGDFDGAVAFPSVMMRALVEAAQRGDRRYETRLFDGSEGGEKVFETVSTIGQQMDGDRNARLEPVMRGEVIDKIPRWPVAISYYDTTPGDRVPVYTLRSVTFANGVVSDMTFEFPEFSLVARAVRYEALPNEACKR